MHSNQCILCIGTCAVALQVPVFARNDLAVSLMHIGMFGYFYEFMFSVRYGSGYLRSIAMLAVAG